jgi:superfamily II DNA or RNA helicase
MINGLRQLRPQQAQLLEDIDRTMAGGCQRIVVQAPTGFGKTIIAATIAGSILHSGKRAIFTVPALSLIDQTVEKFYAEGVRDVGVIQANHRMTNYARRIQVASAQTLQRRQIPAADLVMIDEVHKWFEFYAQWLKHPQWSDVPFIGLSATPWTRGLGRYFDRLIIGATTQELIDAGYLSKFRVFAPASPDLSDVRTVAGDYHEGDLSQAMDQSTLVADVIDTWVERAAGRPTLCFAVDRAHAKHLQEEFIQAGVPAAYIDAYTEAAERNAIATQFHSGAVRVVCNVGCLTTGIDWDVRCLILARPTRSEMLFVQMVGRGLRTADGKPDCLIFDHSDNHVRLGFVTDISRNELDDGRERQKAVPKEKEVLPKKCPKCTFLKPPKALTCPCCGFTPEPKCKIENREGKLVEFTSRYQAKAAPTEPHPHEFYGELKSIAQERGYQRGWIAHKFKEKFGHWPDGLDHIAAIQPKSATRSWVKSRQIAYAKTIKGAAWR